MFKKIVAITLLINMSLVAQANDIKEYKFIMQEYEPFNWTDGDTLKGGMLEVAKRVCLNMKITCRFESLPMKRVISMLEDGSTTAVLSLVENADRASFTTLSIPVVGSNMSYFGIIGTFKKVNSLNDLAGATVGTVSSSSAEKTVLAHQAKIGKLEVIGETGIPIVLSKLIAGRYGDKGLAFSNQDVFLNSLEKLKVKNVEIVFTTQTDQFRIAFSKKATNPEFIEKFNTEILKLRKSGELKKILKPFKLKPAA